VLLADLMSFAPTKEVAVGFVLLPPHGGFFIGRLRRLRQSLFALRKGIIRGEASLALEKHLSLVKLETRPHRIVAQENWGLSAEQMKGCHVHHRVALSEGGTNDPSNLFVCSPSMHRWGWHEGDRGFGEWGEKGGQRSVETGNAGWVHVSRKVRSENGRKNGKRHHENKTGLFAATPEEWSARNRINGTKGAVAAGRSTFEKGVGIFGMSAEAATARNKKGASIINRIQWLCLETGHISTSGPLTRWQKKRGVDPARRARLTPEESAFIFVWA
jgi:hypothetical protein